MRWSGEQSSSREEFEPDRNNWLRKHHRPALVERFKDVFGNDGVALYHQFMAAFRVLPENGEAFQSSARACLRGAARIPQNSSGSRRRIQYMKTCIAEAHKEQQGNVLQPEEEYFSLSLPQIVEAIAKKSHVSEEAIFRRLGQLLSIYAARKDVKDGVLFDVAAKAMQATNPIRYLAAVIRNDRRRRI
jgi:hypothetical protein